MKDKSKTKFSIKDRLLSFKYAFSGLKTLFREEHNIRIHTVIAIAIIIMGLLFGISSTEWLIVFVLIALVFCLEIVNSAIERLCDFISPERNESIKKIKDLSAASVFVAAIISIICGAIIFIPRLYNLYI